VRAVEHAPVVDELEGVGVVVPVAVAVVIVQQRVPHEVEDAVDLVDGVLVGVQRVGVHVEVGVVAPPVDRLRDGVLPVIVVEHDVVRGCGRGERRHDGDEGEAHQGS